MRENRAHGCWPSPHAMYEHTAFHVVQVECFTLQAHSDSNQTPPNIIRNHRALNITKFAEMILSHTEMPSNALRCDDHIPTERKNTWQMLIWFCHLPRRRRVSECLPLRFQSNHYLSPSLSMRGHRLSSTTQIRRRSASQARGTFDQEGQNVGRCAPCGDNSVS